MRSNTQNQLYKDRIAIRQEFGYNVIDKKQYNFLWTYLKKNRTGFLLFTSLLAFQAGLEIIFIILSNSILESATKQYYQAFSNWFLGVGIILIFSYVVLVYLAIFYERKFVLGITNKIRETMFANVVNKEVTRVPAHERMSIITKISYHLSLFTLGLDNAGVSAVRWIFYFTALAVYIIVFHQSYVYYLLGVFAASLILYWAAYKIADNYVSKEAASYSKIVDQIVNTFFNFNLIKKLRMENSVKKMLNRVVAVDTYFRIRRDIWIRYSSRVVIILLIIGTAFFAILRNSHAININLNGNLFFHGVIVVYAVRLLYMSVRAGIYTTPLRMGIFLCVPKNEIFANKSRVKWNWKQITFISNKVKLFEEGAYFKDFRITLQKGERYLFTSASSYSGKTALAELFTGMTRFSRHSYLVKVGNERMAYNEWAETFAKKYLLIALAPSYLTVGEFLFGKSKQNIIGSDVEVVNEIISQNPVFNQLSFANNMLANPMEVYATNYITQFILHALGIMINRPELIAIDNFWIDLKYPEINNMLLYIDEALPNSTIVVFARNTNQILKYNKIYEVKKDSIV
jgi:hypothetical protein